MTPRPLQPQIFPARYARGGALRASALRAEGTAYVSSLTTIAARQLGATQKRRDGARTLHSPDLGLPACREACTGSGASHRPPAPQRPVLLVGAALSRAAAASRRVHGRRAPSYRSGCGGRWSSPSVTAWRRAQAASTFAFGGARTSTSSSHAKLLVAKPAECTLSKRTTT